MPAFMVALGGMFLTLAGTLVGRVLLALGLSFVTYAGFDLAINALLIQIKSNMSSLPVDILNFMGYMWVDKAIGMMFSAYAAALVLKMSASGVITKLVRK